MYIILLSMDLFRSVNFVCGKSMLYRLMGIRFPSPPVSFCIDMFLYFA